MPRLFHSSFWRWLVAVRDRRKEHVSAPTYFLTMAHGAGFRIHVPCMSKDSINAHTLAGSHDKVRLQVGAYDHNSGGINYYTLKEEWDVDDHNSNSWLVLPDKRLMACYTRHNKRGLFCRSTSKPEDIRAWEDEVTVTDALVTYSQPVHLSDEGRFYIFWRGPSWKPTFAWSTDGRRWSEPRILVQEKGKESENVRPYLKVVSDGKGQIHFAFTDGHPHDETQNSIYYLKYEKGAFYKADGTKVGE